MSLGTQNPMPCSGGNYSRLHIGIQIQLTSQDLWSAERKTHRRRHHRTGQGQNTLILRPFISLNYSLVEKNSMAEPVNEPKTLWSTSNDVNPKPDVRTDFFFCNE